MKTLENPQIYETLLNWDSKNEAILSRGEIKARFREKKCVAEKKKFALKFI